MEVRSSAGLPGISALSLPIPLQMFFILLHLCDFRAKTAAEGTSNTVSDLQVGDVLGKCCQPMNFLKKLPLQQHQHAEQLLPGCHHQGKSPSPVYSPDKLLSCVTLIPSLPPHLFRLSVFTNSSPLLCSFCAWLGWQQRGGCGALSSHWPQDSC